MYTGDRNRTYGFLLFLGLCGCLLIFISNPGQANAAWPSDPSLSLPICNAAGSQYGPKLIKVTDGYIVFWQDGRRSTNDIYAQKFDVKGNMKWVDNGRVIAAGNTGVGSNQLLYNSQSLSGIVSDTQGGAIVLWTEGYGCSSGPCSNAWITRVHSNSDVQYGVPPSPGVTIQGADTAVLLNTHGNADAIVPDGEGGAFGIVDVDAWGDWYVFRTDANGAYRSVTSPAVVGARAGARMVYGGNDNGKDYVNIAWWDYGSFAIQVKDPETNYPASIDALYAPWNRITLTTTPPSWSEPSLVSDGAGGMIVVWEDSRNGNTDIFAQKISADGSVQWTATGVPIVVQSETQRRPQVVSDGAGGAVVVWEDFREAPTRVYAQHVGANGSTLWAANGIPISSIYGEFPKIVRSDDGMYIIVWVDSDHNGGTNDYLRAQKIDAAGSLLWPTDSRTPFSGVVIGEIYSADFDIASDGRSGFIVVWELGGDIHARRIAPGSNDFNGDGTPDILWRNTTTGDNVVWHMNGTTISSMVSLTSVPQAWTIVRTVDLNDDDAPDILWRNTTTGDNVVWFMNGNRISSMVSLPSVPLAWTVAGVDYLDNDTWPDILWRNTTTGDNVVWHMNGTTISSMASLTSVPQAWTTVRTVDLNGDDAPDILWRNTTTGDNVVWHMNGTTISSMASLASVPVGWTVAGISDFNGDDAPDILWRHTTTGDNVIWFMNGTTISSMASLASVPVGWTVAGISDFNGDDAPDILWRHTTTGDNVIWYLSSGAISRMVSLPTVPPGWIIGP
jgi:hypothetical protein